MNQKYISFVDCQNGNPVKLGYIITQGFNSDKLSQSGVNSLFFDHYIAHITNIPTSQSNFYFDILHFRGSNNGTIASRVRLDSFALYLSLQLGFKVLNTFKVDQKSFSIGKDLTFFRYYAAAFCVQATVDQSVKSGLNTFTINKYRRIDYQRKLRVRQSSSFLAIKSNSQIPFFSVIFKKNNFKKWRLLAKKVVKRKMRNKNRNKNRLISPITKLKLRSMPEETSLGLRTVRLPIGRIIIAAKLKFSMKKPSGIFPSKQDYRPTKRLKRGFTLKRKRKGKKLKTLKKQSILATKGRSSRKPQTAWGIQFKLFPTDYKESSLNTNKFAQFKSLVSVVRTSQFSFYQVNALSLTRFAFDYQIKAVQKLIRKKIKFSQKFLESYERELVARFRGTGIFFKDLVRVTFFSIYLKKADFLANFFAFTITKLPRDRKELKFVRFLIKVLKTAASQNDSILGVRIRFQGRVNR